MATPKILIAGAGPTGLVLALWLARSGVPFRIVDRKPGPGAGSRALAVQARTLEFYRQLGIAENVVAPGFRIDRLRLRSAAGEIARIPLGEVGRGISPFPFVLSLPQDEHEKLLIECLRTAGHHIQWATELVSFEHDEHSVTAVLRTPAGEESWNGEYLCGCDGAHSIVRRELGFDFPGGTYEQLFFVADAEADGGWAEHDIEAYVALKTFCLVFPVRSPGCYRFVGLVPEALSDAEVRFEDLRAGIERVMNRRITRLNWFSTYRVHHRVAERFQTGRAFLAGDAGHIHSPAGGQGMNTGIGDAVNLAWKLAAVLLGKAEPRLLETYEAERIPFARSLVRTTDTIFEGVVGRGLLARLVRTVFFPYALPAALRFQAVRLAQFRLVSQTRITYRNSPLSEGSVGDLHAGDRLPWLEGVDNFAPLKSLDWQLHVYGRATDDLRAFAADSTLPLHEWPWTPEIAAVGFHKDAVYLVRPDGHIGCAHDTADIAALRRYLDRFGIRSGSASTATRPA